MPDWTNYQSPDNAGDTDELTPDQREDLQSRVRFGWMIRGTQLGFAVLGLYAAIWQGRGWGPILLDGLVIIALQTQLPSVPAWAEKRRKRNTTD